MSTTATPVAAPVETVTPLRPSEAMRLGRMLYPEVCTGHLSKRFDNWSDNLMLGPITTWAVCALGAMAAGYGVHPQQMLVWTGWPDLSLIKHCPGCGKSSFPVVAHLNDEHDWSTERIADWLEGLGL